MISWRDERNDRRKEKWADIIANVVICGISVAAFAVFCVAFVLAVADAIR